MRTNNFALILFCVTNCRFYRQYFQGCHGNEYMCTSEELRRCGMQEKVPIDLSSSMMHIHWYPIYCCSLITPQIDALNNVNTSPIFFSRSLKRANSCSSGSFDNPLALLATCLTFVANFAYSHKTSASSGVRLGWSAYGLLRKMGSEGGGGRVVLMMAITRIQTRIKYLSAPTPSVTVAKSREGRAVASNTLRADSLFVVYTQETQRVTVPSADSGSHSQPIKYKQDLRKTVDIIIILLAPGHFPQGRTAHRIHLRRLVSSSLLNRFWGPSLPFSP